MFRLSRIYNVKSFSDLAHIRWLYNRPFCIVDRFKDVIFDIVNLESDRCESIGLDEILCLLKDDLILGQFKDDKEIHCSVFSELDYLLSCNMKFLGMTPTFNSYCVTALDKYLARDELGELYKRLDESKALGVAYNCICEDVINCGIWNNWYSNRTSSVYLNASSVGERNIYSFMIEHKRNLLFLSNNRVAVIRTCVNSDLGDYILQIFLYNPKIMVELL